METTLLATLQTVCSKYEHVYILSQNALSIERYITTIRRGRHILCNEPIKASPTVIQDACDIILAFDKPSARKGFITITNGTPLKSASAYITAEMEWYEAIRNLTNIKAVSSFETIDGTGDTCCFVTCVDIGQEDISVEWQNAINMITFDSKLRGLAESPCVFVWAPLDPDELPAAFIAVARRVWSPPKGVRGNKVSAKVPASDRKYALYTNKRCYEIIIFPPPSKIKGHNFPGLHNAIRDDIMVSDQDGIPLSERKTIQIKKSDQRLLPGAAAPVIAAAVIIKRKPKVIPPSPAMDGTELTPLTSPSPPPQVVLAGGQKTLGFKASTPLRINKPPPSSAAASPLIPPAPVASMWF